jgi:hypothetical protein
MQVFKIGKSDGNHHICDFCDSQPTNSSSFFLIEAVQANKPAKTILRILRCPKHRRTISRTDSQGLTALSHALRKRYKSQSKTFDIVKALVTADRERRTLFVQNESVAIPLTAAIDALVETMIPEEIIETSRADQLLTSTFQDLFLAYSLGVSTSVTMPSSHMTDTLRFLIRETYLAAFSLEDASTPPLLHMLLQLSRSHIGTLRRKEATFRYSVFLPISPPCTALAVATAIMDKYPDMIFQRDHVGNVPLHLTAFCHNELLTILHQPFSSALVEGEQTELQRIVHSLLCRQKPKERLIHEIIERYPNSAQMENCDGEIPLHFALKYSKELHWRDDGIHALWQGYPRALTMADAKLRLFPFMIAASRDSDTETIYCLLREAPGVISITSR